MELVKAMPKFQFGFKSHHSTVQQLLCTTEQINKKFELCLHTGAVFIDNSKVFDKVWHEGHLFKLKKINTPINLFNIIKSFLTNRLFVVKVNDEMSNFKSFLRF